MQIDYAGVVSELADGSLIRLVPGERLWKLYFLRSGRGEHRGIEHRIFTKEQVDGAVTLVSFSVQRLEEEPGRSSIAVSRDIPKDLCDTRGMRFDDKAGFFNRRHDRRPP